eukprot:TRINITY_DN1367_c0_g2_i8.p1 TRINITY_DN1367_c0_g2~~TRINITY_DN1367_c0_g2_i8.p1  ORF type:complete len:359 (-),score=52.25 TRINITY_DN1367_c0_g2_i8:197-1273(-)
MGLCTSSSDGDALNSKAIERQMTADHKIMRSLVKLLLLGAGDSGKSTFCKQMKIVHKKGLSQVEYDKMASVLRDNALQSMVALLNVCDEMKNPYLQLCQALGVNLPSNLEGHRKTLLEATELTPEVAACISELWKYKDARQAFELKNKASHVQILSAAPYYFEHVERFASPHFRPTDEDTTLAKLRTTGVTETNFEVSGNQFSMLDVGGQRSERRKWLHCFEGVSAVIYLAALDEYDLTMEEDNDTNRMEESLKLFKEVVGSPWFSEHTCILFLNKVDLFQDKIKQYPLSMYFNDFPKEDSQNFDRSVEFIRNKYEKIYSNGKLHCFTTCAIDRSNCERVFSCVMDAVCNSNLVVAGM